MRRSLALAPLVAVALALAGCGGSTTPVASTTTPPASTDSSTPAATATAPADAGAARAEVKKNWKTFFASSTGRSVAAGLLENGAQLGPALAKATQEDKQTGGQRSARVKKVTFTSPTQANVTYKLHVGTTALDSAGVAVLQDGVWRVSALTFCTLVELGNGNKHVKSCP